MDKNSALESLISSVENDDFINKNNTQNNSLESLISSVGNDNSNNQLINNKQQVVPGVFNPEDIPEYYSEDMQRSTPRDSKTNFPGRPIQSIINQGLDFMQGVNQIAAGTFDFVATEPLEAILQLTGRADKSLTGTDTLGISNIKLPKLKDTVQDKFSEPEAADFYQKAGQYSGLGVGLTSGVKKGVDYVTNQAHRHFIGSDSVILGIMKQVSKNPLYKETAAGASAATLGEVGSKYGGDFGEFVGTLVGGGIPYYRKNPKQLQKIGYTESTQKSAAAILKTLTANPNRALSSLDEMSASKNLTAAQKTNDPMIMELERSLALDNKELASNFQDRFRQAQISLKEEFEKIVLPDGNINRKGLNNFLVNKKEDLLNQIDDRINSAYLNIKNIISISNKDPLILSKTIRSEIDKSFIDIKNQERKLWSAIQDDIQVDTNQVKQTALDIIASADKSTRLPVKELEFILGKKISNTADGWKIGKETFKNKPFLSEQESARELMSFRSNVNSDIRQQQSGTAFKTLSIKNLNEIQTALINALDNPIYLDEDVRGSYDTAKNFTKKFHEVFEQGTIGKTIRSSKTGDNVPPEGTLQSLLGNTEVTQAVGIRELKELDSLLNYVNNTTSSKSNLLKTTSQFLANKFSETVSDVTSLQKFLIDNRQALKKLPELNNAVKIAADGINKESTRIANLEARKNVVNSSILQKLTNSEMNGSQIVETVLKSVDPKSVTNKLFIKIRKDPEAMKAMKNSIGEYILDRVLITSKSNPDIEQQLSKARLVTVVKKQMRPLLEKFYTKKDWRNLQIIFKEISTLTASESAKATPLPVNRNLLIDFLGKLGITQSVKSGSIVVQSGLAKISRQFTDQLTDKNVKELLVKAVSDDELLKILLKKNLNKKDIDLLKNKVLPIYTAYGINSINNFNQGQE